MDDLIIIILTLIIAVAGTIGQIKKKKQAQTEPNKTADEEPSGDFWSFLDEFTEQPLQKGNVGENKEVENIPEKKDEKPKYSFTAKNEGQSSAEKTESLKDEIRENIKDEKKEKISDTFSLKKAVIYSEILNRKYT